MAGALPGEEHPQGAGHQGQPANPGQGLAQWPIPRGPASEVTDGQQEQAHGQDASARGGKATANLTVNPTYAMSGTLNDPNTGNPVAGVSIKLTTVSLGNSIPDQTVTTDANGAFNFAGLPNNSDGEAAAPALTSGTNYRWGVILRDLAGNSVSQSVLYTP